MRTEIGRQAEHWPWNGLCGPVARHKVVFSQPSGVNQGILKKRQHNVTTAEDQRAGTVKCFKNGKQRIAAMRKQRQAYQQQHKNGQ